MANEWDCAAFDDANPVCHDCGREACVCAVLCAGCRADVKKSDLFIGGVCGDCRDNVVAAEYEQARAQERIERGLGVSL